MQILRQCFILPLESISNLAFLIRIKQQKTTNTSGRSSEMMFMVSFVATLAILAIIVDFQLDPQQNSAQAAAQSTTSMADDRSMTSPHHDMTKMIMGQDGSIMGSEQTSAKDAQTHK